MINTRWLTWWRHRERIEGRIGGEALHVSLGTFCHTAAALRDCGLRPWTGPFDWIFSDPAMIAACIEDDFATLLDPGELRSVPASELTHGAKRQCRHLAYEARYNLPTLFNHHDPAANGGDRQRLERATERFRSALGSGWPLRFYMLSQRDWPEEEITGLRAVLNRRVRDVGLVLVRLEPGSAEPRWTRTTRPDGLVELRVYTRSGSLGAVFPDGRDNGLLSEALLDYAGAPDGRPVASRDPERP